jgi:hypothetical protein
VKTCVSVEVEAIKQAGKDAPDAFVQWFDVRCQVQLVRQQARPKRDNPAFW